MWGHNRNDDLLYMWLYWNTYKIHAHSYNQAENDAYNLHKWLKKSCLTLGYGGEKLSSVKIQYIF